MDLNWSFEVILSFGSLIPFVISFSISLHQYLKTRYQHNLFLCLTWILCLLWILTHGLAKLFLSKQIYWWSGLFITGYLVSIIFFGESLENEIQISKYLLLVLLLQSLIVVFAYDETFVVIEKYQNGELGLRLNHPYIKIYLNVPPAIKGKTFLALIGVIIFSSAGILYVMLGGTDILPGLNMLFTFLGALLFGISFLTEPRMLHVLSFKMLRLQVIDTKSGIGIYSYNWEGTAESGDDILFSGMVQGISLIVQESVKRGELQEITLSEGILIIKKIPNSSIACVLVATKSTAPLRQALSNFAEKFDEKFQDKFDNICDISNFSQTTGLIKECFPFLWDI
jgi:hypothetical protein